MSDVYDSDVRWTRDETSGLLYPTNIGDKIGIGTAPFDFWSVELSVVGNIETRTAGVLRMRPVGNDWNMDIGVTGYAGNTSINFADGWYGIRMVILSNGNVGIGTVSPASRLDIGAGALNMSVMSAPSTPAADNAVIYVKASGTTPNRVISIMVKMENGVEKTLASCLV